MKHITDSAELGKVLADYDTFLFDCDGVVWNGDELTPGAAEALSSLRQHSKRLAFITNNATQCRKGYREKFKKLGIDVQENELFTSGSAAAQYLKRKIPDLPKERSKIYLIGQKGLQNELDLEGVEYSGGTGNGDDEHMPFQDFTSIVHDSTVGLVLAGFDMHITYKKLCKAFNYLACNGAHLILTNDDSTVILPDGNGFAPGEGAMFAPLLHARPGLEPVVVGKPNQILMESVREIMNFDPGRTLMIGDRMETDVTFGRRGGIDTLLVLTGADNEEALQSAKDDARPHFVVQGIGDFVDALRLSSN